MTDSLHNYLEGADGAGKVLAHARLLARLGGLFQEIAPPHLGQASSLANYKSGIVLIHASSGAVATKLRQMAPTLVDELLKRGVECRGLQVKVQARARAAAPHAPAPRPLSIRASEQLSALSGSLPVSPLRSALEQLLARSAREE
ncbi:DciA family protein [Candidatus Accumulibacter sp. ACC007]|uniref:DciA family protein n=1 Tax=Candidatus Accumulibacter sp. ACC007 TaxID=2823333 RepID=UPI0025B9E1AD|nr:DciA family protein [Candidatus Accumulibacter sp. ACC007]